MFGCTLCRSSTLGSYDWGGNEIITTMKKAVTRKKYSLQWLT